MGPGFTFETWVLRTPTGSGPIFGWGGSFPGQTNAPAGVRLQMLSNGNLTATLIQTNGSTTSLTPTTPVLTSNTWNHVALSCDHLTRQATLYVNGTPVAQVQLPGGSTPIALRTLGILGLGYAASQQQLFGAVVDEPSLYNRALTAEEIQSVYAAQQTGKCPPPAALVCANSAADLAGWWRGESNTLDSVNFNHGVMLPVGVSAAASYTTGAVGAAFSLRVSNHVLISNTPALDVGAGPGLTIETWYNPGTLSLPLLDWNNGAGVQGVTLGHSYTRGPNYLEANFVDTNGIPHVISSPSLPSLLNQWRHVAVSYDKATGVALMFVDGSLVTQTNLGSFTPRTTGHVYLGYRPPGNYPGNGLRFTGLLDEVAIYNRALSAAELRCVTRSGVNAKLPPVFGCLPPAAGIVSWWRGETNGLDSVAGNHGVKSSPVEQTGSYTNGLIGQAFVTGSRDYLAVPFVPALNVSAGPGFTVEGWINPKPGQSPGAVFGWQNPGVTLEYNVSFPGGLRVALVNSNNQSRFVSTAGGIIKTSQWQHVALTFDRASGWATLYVNGFITTATNLGGFIPRTTGTFYLGWRASGGNYFQGALDEFALYSRALTSQEISSLARAAQGRCQNPPTIVTHPQSQSVPSGSNVTFHVVAMGNPLLRYQWGKGVYHPDRNQPLPGQTNATLVLSNVGAAARGLYWVRVTNAFGIAVSTNIALEVNSAPEVRVAIAPLVHFLGRTNMVLAPVCAPAWVLLDGRTSRDAESDPLAFQWLSGPNQLGATASLTNSFLPGEYQIALTVSDGVASNTLTRSFWVVSPADAAVLLMSAVIAEATVRPEAKPLVNTLRPASAAFTRCDLAAGLDALLAFQAQLRTLLAPTQPDLSAQWDAAAQLLVDTLRGPPPQTGAPAPALPALTQSRQGQLTLQFSALPAWPVWVEASVDLQHWETIGLLEIQPDGHATFADPNASQHPQRFYRILSP